MDPDMLQPGVDIEKWTLEINMCRSAHAQPQEQPPRLTAERFKQWLRSGLSWPQRKRYWGVLVNLKDMNLADTSQIERALDDNSVGTGSGGLVQVRNILAHGLHTVHRRGRIDDGNSRASKLAGNLTF